MVNNARFVLGFVAVLVAIAAAIAIAAAATAQRASSAQFHAELAPLNDSSIHATAALTFTGSQLTIDIQTDGLAPGEVLAAGLYAPSSTTAAACRSAASDTNHDGVVSVDQGAAAYGAAVATFAPIGGERMGPRTRQCRGTGRAI